MGSDAVLTITSVVLAGVTTWYAYLTMRLSRSSEQSAKYSRQAAEAARQAAQVGLAGLKVEFTLNPVYTFGESDALTAIHVECRGSNLYVHAVRLDSFGVKRGDGESATELGEWLELVDTSVYAFRGSPPALPLLMHTSEVAEFGLDVSSRAAIDRVDNLAATILYSLDGDSAPRERFVEWVSAESLSGR